MSTGDEGVRLYSDRLDDVLYLLTSDVYKKADKANVMTAVQTCVSWPTAALVSVDDVRTRCAITTRTGRTLIHFSLTPGTSISCCA